jgi:hypothetical protein
VPALRVGHLELKKEKARMAKKTRIPEHLRRWIEARRRFRLSHMHIQMARELGMNPRKFGKLANHRQERWKAPLPIFIESIYFKRFGKEKPDRIQTIAEVAAAQLAKKAAKKLTKQARKAERMADGAPPLASPLEWAGRGPCCTLCSRAVAPLPAPDPPSTR